MFKNTRSATVKDCKIFLNAAEGVSDKELKEALSKFKKSEDKMIATYRSFILEKDGSIRPIFTTERRFAPRA